MTAGAVILTTTSFSRTGSFDPMEVLGSCSVLQRLVRTFQLSGVRHVVLPVPARGREAMEKHMSHWGVLCVEVSPQASPEEQLRRGLELLAPLCGRVLLTAADIPFLSPASVRVLLESEAPVCRPVIDGRPGGILSVDPAAALSVLLEKMGTLEDLLGQVTSLPLKDEGALPQARAMGLFPQLLARSQAHGIHATAKLRLCGDRPFFGPGSAQLLSLIEITGSVREACQQMGLSYSKGRHMILIMEEELGKPVVLRQQGGRNGGAAFLTDYGKDLIGRFQTLEERCQAMVRQAYDEIFSDLSGAD